MRSGYIEGQARPETRRAQNAAMPPDMRKVYDLPQRVLSVWGYAPA
ncbi:MAG TPA: hypothetical protein VKC61_13075 [Pyrinomonadaceae bacterium]|nr:hypothetical protein [Pyrinomonadaceae bacterium]